MQDCSNYIADAMKLLQSRTKPSVSSVLFCETYRITAIRLQQREKVTAMSRVAFSQDPLYTAQIWLQGQVSLWDSQTPIKFLRIWWVIFFSYLHTEGVCVCFLCVMVMVVVGIRFASSSVIANLWWVFRWMYHIETQTKRMPVFRRHSIYIYML